MNITISKAVGRVEVVIIRLDGQLDGQSYLQLIDKARELFKEGVRDFLLDLSELTYISSAGLVALHSVALLTNGEQLPDAEAGWSTYRSVKNSATLQTHIKLLNPREEVKSVLEMVGFDRVFSVFTDYDEAVKSF
ncbi:MAG: STAS domain-containing protein [Anaerolineales bacterium]